MTTNNQTTDQAIKEKLIRILKDLQLDTMGVTGDLGDYDNEVDYLTSKLHWAEVQILSLLANEVRKAETRARIDELYWLNKMYRNRRDKSLIGRDLNELRHIDKDLDEIVNRIKQLQGDTIDE